MKIASASRFVLRAILFCLLGACVNVNMDQRANPERRYFTLAVSGNRIAARAQSGGVLKLAAVRVAQPFDSKGFIYRIASESFETDFYNHFLVTPGAMLTDQLRQALTQANVFQVVVHSNSLVEPTHLLETTVDELYGDFTGAGPGKAVLAMAFFMRQEASTGAQIRFQKQYEKSIALQARSPDALVEAWNHALEEIIVTLVSDLERYVRTSDSHEKAHLSH